MKAPGFDDRLVKVTAYLSDADFGYENWHARQFASPRDRKTRPALLVICRDETERDRMLVRFGMTDERVEILEKRVTALEVREGSLGPR